ncbi:MAG: NYN domain-containing protein [Nitrososphaerales archaeon]
MKALRMDKSAVFIDGGYLSKVLEREFGKAKVDLLKFSEELAKGTDRLRTYYYNCMPYQSNPPTEEERKRFAAMDRYLYALRKLPRFEVRMGRLAYFGGQFFQKRVDIMLAVDLVRMSWGKQIGKAILVTGDSDFVPAVYAAKDAGVVTHLYYSKPVHDELLLAYEDP